MFLETNGLEDIHDHVLDKLPPTTRIGSSTRIDCITATEGILQEVQAAGFRILHEGITSDHIMLWADINIDRFFGSEGHQITPPQFCEFSIDNIEIRGKFLTEPKTIYDHQNLPARIYALENEIASTGINNTLATRYNSFDDSKQHNKTETAWVCPIPSIDQCRIDSTLLEVSNDVETS